MTDLYSSKMYQVYRKEVNDLAVSIIEEARKNGYGDIQIENKIDDFIHEVVAWHQWVIYTNQAKGVIALSEACTEEFAKEGLVDPDALKNDDERFWGSLAYCCLRHDVREEILRILE